jgi:uncharacterized protein YkwD
VTTAKRAVALVVVCAAMLALLCGAASTALGAARGAVVLTKAERQLLSLINLTRAQHGLRQVRVDATLTKAARKHTAEMLRLDRFSHLSANGRNVAQRARAAGYGMRARSAWRVGEILGWGCRGAGDPENFLRMWLSSSFHRSVLLNPGWRDVGIGLSTGSFMGHTDASVATVDFGRH